MLSPVVTHVPCELDQQRRIHEARRWALARALGHRTLLDRVLRRRRPRRELVVTDLRDRGEDVWRSLRF